VYVFVAICLSVCLQKYPKKFRSDSDDIFRGECITLGDNLHSFLDLDHFPGFFTISRQVQMNLRSETQNSMNLEGVPKIAQTLLNILCFVAGK